ncbi:MAG: hypothetical protein PHS15_00880 [Clostridiaceae bacterium]|nr:hypothetical protein [Clostridiaceae bacterium]
MSAVDKELIRIVRRIRDRLHAALIINDMILGVAAALCLGIGVAIASRFVPIYNVYLNIFKIVGAAVLTAFLYSAFRTPKDTYTALKADSFGLKERTVTALELVGNQSTFAMLEKNDALEHLKNMDYKKRISLRPNKRYLLICFILTMTLALSGFIPNPMAGKAEELHKIKAKISEQQKKVDKLVEKVKSNPKLSEEQKKELEKKLSELKKELKTAKDEKEINKVLGRTEKKLEYIKDKYAPGEDLNKIADALSKNEMTKALADMIKNGDKKAFKDNIKKMAEVLKKLSTEEKQKLAEELSKLAQEIKNNSELSQAFDELAKKLATGELGDISSELSELDQSISELMENESVRDAISELTRELSNSNTSQSDGQQGQQGQDGSGHQGQGNNPGAKGQQGQGNQPGGNGIGGGQGSGAGSGTNMGNENQTPIPPSSSGISKKDSSHKKDGEYEKIFTPQTLGGEGDTSNLSGTKGAGGTTEQVITDKSQTVRGSSVPYNQVVGQYKDRAMESMNTSDIPPGMKDMVKEYFTSLEE